MHLAMRDLAAGGGDQPAYLLGNMRDALDPVVQEIDLTAPVQLPEDHFAHQLVVVLLNIGLDRHPALRRIIDQGHIPDTRKRHVQSARDGGGREGEHVNVLLHLLDALFVRDPEALLFVDDQKPQLMEIYIFAQNLVRSDDNIYRALFQAAQGLGRLSF